MATPDLLLHPVRLRIVLEAAGEEVTAGDLAARLPDVAQATLYRQLGVLVEAGLLEVVAERRVRGGVERTYRLAGEAVVDAQDAATMTPEEHRRGFLSFLGALIGGFERYLADPASDPATDPVGYRQAALWLTDDEAEQMAADLGRALEPYLARSPAQGRRRVRLSTILVPDASTGGARG